MLYSSTELIEKAKERFKLLDHKGYDWKSFCNGFLEAYGVVNTADLEDCPQEFVNIVDKNFNDLI